MRGSFESVLGDSEVIEELREQAATVDGILATRLGEAAASLTLGGSEIASIPSPGSRVLELVDDIRRGRLPPDSDVAEAIVRHFGRPVLLIQDGRFEQPSSNVWRQRLKGAQRRVRRSIAATGRIEILYHPDYRWLGTGYVVDEGVVVTNRHVAAIFAERLGTGAFAFRRNPLGVALRANIDFREEHGSESEHEVEIAEILDIEEAGHELPDMAILRLASTTGIPDPVILSDGVEDGQFVASVGYPASDGRRNDPDAMRRIFGDIYDVKRFAPGAVMETENDTFFTHDCTTLGGNSGSTIVDISTGHVVGLHYAGRRETANFAVKARVLRDRLARVLGRGIAPEDLEERPVPTGRGGYDEAFLGDGAIAPMPGLPRALANHAAKIKRGFEGAGSYVLPYTNFSIVMNKARRLAFFTAVNIDGGKLHRIPRRRDVWTTDARISADHQVDNALYRGNDLDRGHLVRRLDPMWGSRRTARQAQEDTFHYTNAAPQHKDLNRDVWLDLEDYILDNTDEHDLKISVFTGPVFRDDDPSYRDLTRIPRQYWKVVAFRNRRGRLRATAYLLSQSQMISDLEAPFGAFRTYQVSVGTIATLTGLQMDGLRHVDPLAGIESLQEAREIENVSRIVL